MEIYLAGKTAFELWNNATIKEERSGHLFDIPANHTPTISKSEANELADRYRLTLPFEVAVASAECRRNSKKLSCTTHGAYSPAHQYMKIRDGLFVARPELCLMQIAERCTPLELIWRANIMAGCFTLYKQEKFKPRWPATSQLGIVQFMERCGKCNGKTALSKALPYVIDHSYSPMETVLALLLCLPRKRGGYGLPLPELNKKVKLASLRDPSAPVSAFRPDLLWEEQRLIIEYDSAEWHAGEHKLASDAARRNTFICNGYTVLSMTPDQLFNQPAMDELACFIADALKRPRPDLSTAAFQQRRDLRAELFQVAGLKMQGEHGE